MKKPVAFATGLNDGGGRWIRTIEGRADRFTICSLWPLGNPSTGYCYTVLGKNTAMKRAIANFKKDGGGRWIRTIEGRADRFTICSLWPLGNPSTGCCYTVFGKNTAIETRYCGFQERWWREMDSNHRRQSRQIYNLFPLATREPLHGVLLHCIWQKYSNEMRYCELQERWWREMDSNHRRQSRQIYNLFPLATREPLHGVLLHCIWQKYSN